MESPYRWLILAGLAFGAGCIGAMAMIAYGWPHLLPRLWLVAGLVLTAAFLVLALLQWKAAVEAEMAAEEQRAADSRR
jgi:hypothetical protein